VTSRSVVAEPDDVVGTVAETNPAAGAQVAPDQAITIFVYTAAPDSGTDETPAPPTSE
jgi:serine/threonine-protein kinase